MSKVSVIVPVYNVEMYLDKCIESIVNQSLKDIEIIVINDGSTDNSLELCKMWQKKDLRIQVYSKENGGLSSARNEGLKYAKGEYVSFIDSDDWIENDMLQNMFDLSVLHKADVCLCDYTTISKKGRQAIHLELEKKYLEGEEIRTHILYPMMGVGIYKVRNIHPCVWRCLYRRALLVENNIKFTSEREVFAEDLLFNIEVLACSKRVCALPVCYYNYVFSPGSLYRRYREDLPNMHDRLMQYIEEIYKRYNIYDKQSLVARRIIMAGIEVANEAKKDNPYSVQHRIDTLENRYNKIKLQESIRLCDQRHAILRNKLLIICIKYKLVKVSYFICVIRNYIKLL